MAGRSGHGYFAAYHERGLVRKMRLILVVQVRMYMRAGAGATIQLPKRKSVQIPYTVPKGMKVSRPQRGIRHSWGRTIKFSLYLFLSLFLSLSLSLSHTHLFSQWWSSVREESCRLAGDFEAKRRICQGETSGDWQRRRINKGETNWWSSQLGETWWQEGGSWRKWRKERRVIKFGLKGREA